MNTSAMPMGPARLRRSNTFSPNVANATPRLEGAAAWDDLAATPRSAFKVRISTARNGKHKPDYDASGARYCHDNQCESHVAEENEQGDTDNETDDCRSPPDSTTASAPRKVRIYETVAQTRAAATRRARRNSADVRFFASPCNSTSTMDSTATNNQSTTSESSSSNINTASKLSDVQKRGCFKYIKRRHSIAMAFASMGKSTGTNTTTTSAVDANDALSGGEQLESHWEFVKVKQGVEIFKSKRSRCEIRGVTRVNGSVKNVMSLLAAGESTESFAHAQSILLGKDQVLEARVLASCVPSSASRYFHCGLKYMAIKNPFGLNPLDLVFLDYTDVSTTPDDKLIGYRIIESIRVPEFRSVSKYTRASIRCEAYIVRETDVPGVVEVSFASHMDPKSKYVVSKRHTWLDQVAVRLSNLRSYAEKASFSHRMVLEKGHLIKSETRHHCAVCETGFSFLRKRHNCRLCGEVTCGRCCRKLPVFVGTETTRVRVCLGCMIQSRRQPDELGRLEVSSEDRRNSIGNSTFIAYDEVEDVEL
jgi:hypothetical protein